MLQALPNLSPTEVRNFRARMELSQTEFAERFQMSRQGVEKWERYGAPWYWRMVFAALDTGIAPYNSKSSVELLMDKAIEQCDATNTHAIFNLSERDFRELQNQWRLATTGVMANVPMSYRDIDVYLDDGASHLTISKDGQKFEIYLGEATS